MVHASFQGGFAAASGDLVGGEASWCSFSLCGHVRRLFSLRFAGKAGGSGDSEASE